MKPIIGIVVCGTENNRQFVSQTYISAIEHFKACPILIPHISDHNMYEHYARICDGFLFCGGGDITPALFDEPLLSSVGTTDTKTDLFHLSLMAYLLNTTHPILAICRGMQVLNVTMEGSLYQDNHLAPSPVYEHMQNSTTREDPAHKVYFKTGSLMHSICGDYCYTNSYHHQSIHIPGRYLTITGASSDGVVEAIESTKHPFVIGVQWHPECMYSRSKEMQALFHAFIAACASS